MGKLINKESQLTRKVNWWGKSFDKQSCFEIWKVCQEQTHIQIMQSFKLLLWLKKKKTLLSRVIIKNINSTYDEKEYQFYIFFSPCYHKAINWFQTLTSIQSSPSKEKTNISLILSTTNLNYGYVIFLLFGNLYLFICNSLYSNLCWKEAMSFETWMSRIVKK